MFSFCSRTAKVNRKRELRIFSDSRTVYFGRLGFFRAGAVRAIASPAGTRYSLSLVDAGFILYDRSMVAFQIVARGVRADNSRCSLASGPFAFLRLPDPVGKKF